MGFRPLHIGVSLEFLLGKTFMETLSDYEIHALESACADGILDEEDIKAEGNIGACPDYDNRTARLWSAEDETLYSCHQEIVRRFHYQLSRFAHPSKHGWFIDKAAAASFQSFLTQPSSGEASGLERIRDGSTASMIGAELFCRGAHEGNCKRFVIDDPALTIVVHPLSIYERETAQEGIDRLVAQSRREEVPTFYLVEQGSPFTSIYPSDLQIDRMIHSQGGMNPIDFRGTELHLAGGYFKECYLNSLFYLLQNRGVDTDLTVRIDPQAVFSSTDRTLATTLDLIRQESGEEGVLTYLQETLNKKNADFHRYLHKIDGYKQHSYRQFNWNVIIDGARHPLLAISDDRPTITILFDTSAS